MATAKKTLAPKATVTPTPETLVVPIATATPQARIEPKDFAEAQDLAIANGIDIVGKTFPQLVALLNNEQVALPSKADKQKKLVKVPAISVPDNIHPDVKAAMDKANAEIALAKAKVAEMQEAAKKLKEDAKALEAKAKEDRIAAAKLAKETAEKEKAENAEKAQAAQLELAAAAEVAEKEAVEAETIAATAVEKAKGLRLIANLAKKAAGQKVKVGSSNSGRKAGAEKDMTKYIVGETYTLPQGEAVCKKIFLEPRCQQLFYIFQSTTDKKKLIHKRAYAEDTVTA